MASSKRRSTFFKKEPEPTELTSYSAFQRVHTGYKKDFKEDDIQRAFDLETRKKIPYPQDAKDAIAKLRGKLNAEKIIGLKLKDIETIAEKIENALKDREQIPKLIDIIELYSPDHAVSDPNSRTIGYVDFVRLLGDLAKCGVAFEQKSKPDKIETQWEKEKNKTIAKWRKELAELKLAYPQTVADHITTKFADLNKLWIGQIVTYSHSSRFLQNANVNQAEINLELENLFKLYIDIVSVRHTNTVEKEEVQNYLLVELGNNCVFMQYPNKSVKQICEEIAKKFQTYAETYKQALPQLAVQFTERAEKYRKLEQGLVKKA